VTSTVAMETPSAGALCRLSKWHVVPKPPRSGCVTSRSPWQRMTPSGPPKHPRCRLIGCLLRECQLSYDRTYHPSNVPLCPLGTMVRESMCIRFVSLLNLMTNAHPGFRPYLGFYVLLCCCFLYFPPTFVSRYGCDHTAILPRVYNCIFYVIAITPCLKKTVPTYLLLFVCQI